MTLEITPRAREIAARTTHCGATGQAIIAGRMDLDECVEAAQLAMNECAAEIERMREALGEICENSNLDWDVVAAEPREALEKIHTMAVEAYFSPALDATND